MAQVLSGWTLGQDGCGLCGLGICSPRVPPSFIVPRGWSAKGAAEGILDGLGIPDPVSSEETPQ